LFLDGDMIVRDDIAQLWKLRDPGKAVQVVQHDYATRFPTKYFGQPNRSYPRKMWSSVVLWNCGHPRHRILSPDFIQHATGSFLHRFEWLEDKQIGALPPEWNWLADEYEHNDSAKLVHYTIGGPYLAEYALCDYSEEWHEEARAMMHCEQAT
jgi:hypothetical protein